MKSTASLYIEIKVETSTKGYWKGSHYISRGMTGHWSKWGGANKDVIQENLSKEWACQSCGDIQPYALTPYKYEYPKGEYIRVCWICYNNGCLILLSRL